MSFSHWLLDYDGKSHFVDVSCKNKPLFTLNTYYLNSGFRLPCSSDFRELPIAWEWGEEAAGFIQPSTPIPQILSEPCLPASFFCEDGRHFCSCLSSRLSSWSGPHSSCLVSDLGSLLSWIIIRSLVPVSTHRYILLSKKRASSRISFLCSQHVQPCFVPSLGHRPLALCIAQVLSVSFLCPAVLTMAVILQPSLLYDCQHLSVFVFFIHRQGNATSCDAQDGSCAVLLPGYSFFFGCCHFSSCQPSPVSLECLPATLYSWYVKFCLLFRKDTLFPFIQDIMYFVSPG